MEFNRLLVGLDLTEMDDQLIRYVNFLEQIFNLEMVYFVHVARDLKLPERIRKKYPNVMAPVDESIERDIESKVKLLYQPQEGTEYKIEIKQGDAIKELMNWSEIKNVDVMVMGRKIEMEGSGVLPGKIARTILCSLLFVPEGFTPRLNKVLVSLDFSNTSGLALDAALSMKESANFEIIIHNAYSVPSGYHTTGKSYEEFKEIMHHNALEDAHEFVEKRELSKDDFTFHLKFDEEDDPGERAYECATELGADMIIMASRGRTGLASILLGSVAEKMVLYDSNIPLMIIKNKNENLGFFKALMRI